MNIDLVRTAAGPLRARAALHRTAFGVLLYCLAAALQPAVADTAAAAADSGSDVEEVVVTAERRSTPLQTTPVSVGVLSGQDLQQQNLTELRDLSSSVASFQVPASSTPSLAYAFIRGIGTISPTYNGAVGIYVDDVYQARIINSGIFGLPDVEQIEVLRGPQGTLYGQNTSAGAIKIISKTPGDEVTGSASLSGGDHGQFNSSGYLAGPLIKDVLSASVAFAHQQMGGFTYDPTLGKNVNEIDTDQGRVKFHYTPAGSDGPDAVLSLYFLRDRSDNAVPSPLNIPDRNPRITYENLDEQIHDDDFLGSIGVTQSLTDQLKLKSITGYREFTDSPDPWSLDGLATNLFEWELNIKQRQFSQEFQLLGDYGPLTFTTGAIYYYEHFIADRPNVTLGRRGGAISTTATDSVGIYGQGHYAITDRFGVTAGLRFYHQQDDYDNSGYVSNAEFEAISPTYALRDLKQDTDGVSPKIGIDYTFTDALYGYASVTRGEKSGGYNPVASAAAIAAIPIAPEKVTTYETGLKIGAATSPTQFNVSVFYNDFRDYQTLLANVVLDGQIINGSVAVNAAKARTYGVEVETTARPVDRLELRLAATALQATLVNFNFITALGGASYDGNQIPYASKITGGASAAYTVPVSQLGDLKVRAEVKYSSKSYTDITNLTVLPAQTYVNLDGIFTPPGKRWDGFVRVRNLTNRTYAIGGIPVAPTVPGVESTTYNPPRMYQVGADYHF